jgi:hypothetical protein
MTIAERPPQLDFEGVPSLSLRRVHLRSVGPRAARMDPFDLRHDTADGTASRVLWSLTNTGGKTTLLRLVTSVVVPAARAQMGNANIGEYVDSGDTSHVVLEWDIAGGDRFVVGAVYEWPGRKRPPGSPIGELKRYLYMFRCNGVEIDDLPFAADGRRRTLEEFRNAVRELMGDNPAAQFVATANQSEWSNYLDTRTPLDPELFRYQMRMNDDESGAEALVNKLNSPEAVVRFFIEALNDDVGMAEFTDTLGDYARQSAQRQAWTVEATFCDALVEALGPLATADVVRRNAREAADLADQKVAELAGELAERIAGDRRDLAELEASHAAAANDAAQLEAELKRLSDLRQQLLLEDARFEAVDAKKDVAEAQQAQHDAEAARDAWAATEPVATWRAAQQRAEAMRRAYQEAEGELLPLRELTGAAAAGLAAKYAALAGEAQEAKTAAQAALKAAVVARGKADRRVSAGTAAKQSAETRLAAISSAADESATTTARLLADRHVRPGESASAALARWSKVVASAADMKSSRTAAHDQADAERKAAAIRVETARNARTEGAGLESEARRRLDAFAAELAAIAGDVDVAVVADELAGAPVDSVRTASAVASLAVQQAATSDRAAAAAEAELGDAEAQLARLERGDLLATAEDIEAIKALLVVKGVGAVTGWEWLARNIADPDERRRRIAARPDVANGLIVTDGARLDDARAVIERAAPETRVAILVIPSTATTTVDRDDTSAGFVVEPHRALWDREWAERTRDELRIRTDRLRNEAVTARTNATRYRQTQVKLEQFVGRWPADVADGLPGLHQAASALFADASSAFDAAAEALSAAERDVEAAQAAVNAAVAEVSDARVHEEATRHGAMMESRATELESTRPEVEATYASAVAEIAAGESDRADADRDAGDAQAKIATAEAQREANRERQAHVGVEPAADVPDSPVHELLATWRQFTDELAAAEAGSDHATRLNEANQRAADTRVQVEALGAAAVEAATALLANFEASTSGMRADALARAEATLRAADRVVAETEAEANRVMRIVEDRTPRDRQVHYALDGEWLVANRDAVADRLARVTAVTAGHRMRLTELQATAAELAAWVTQAGSDLDRLQMAAASLDAEALPGMRPFIGTAAEAQQEARQRVSDRRSADTLASTATEKWADALATVRAAAGASRWPTLESPWKDRCVSGDGESIATDAERWARELHIRAVSLNDDLRELDRHREVLVIKLEQLCQTQLRLLRDVTNASRLPEHMGELSRQAAFKIDFDKAPPGEARGRLAARVDRWAGELAGDPKRAGRGDQRFRWLADATKDLVVERPRAGSWTVQVLKPVIDGTVEYRSPDRVQVEFSGGQELTLAVLLYCTLSQVRANNRTSGARPAGVLLLDNPFGRASNAALIRMQQGLASRAGLQLICATGLSDASVKTAFEGPESCILELRNDRDQRHGLQYLRITDPRVAERVAAGITGDRDVAATDGFLDGSRYSIRRT